MPIAVDQRRVKIDFAVGLFWLGTSMVSTLLLYAKNESFLCYYHNIWGQESSIPVKSFCDILQKFRKMLERRDKTDAAMEKKKASQ